MKGLSFLFLGLAFVFGLGCERTHNPVSSITNVQTPQSLQTVLETPGNIKTKMEYYESKRNAQLRTIKEMQLKKILPQRLPGSGAREIRVPKDFSLIQQAVDQALPGDKITVADGVYNEFIVVTRRGLTITSEHCGKAILRGGFMLYWVDSVKIGGFNIQAGGPDGATLEAIESIHCEFQNNTLSGAFYGIYIFDSPESIVRENKVHHNVIGIKIDLTNKALLKLNEVRGNSLDGIQDFDSAVITYSENQCLGNGRAGLYMERSQYWFTRKRDTMIGNNNRFNDNAVVGIALKASQSNFLGFGNNASNNGLFGILLVQSSDYNNLERWTALDNGIYDCYNSTDNTGNVFTENTFGTCFNCNPRGAILTRQKRRKSDLDKSYSLELR